jgi:hypothetical protein
MKVNWKFPVLLSLALVITSIANAQELNTFKLIDKLISEGTWYVLVSLIVILLVLVVFTWSLLMYGPDIRKLAASSNLYTIFKTSQSNEQLGIDLRGTVAFLEKINSGLETNLANVANQGGDYEKFRGLTTDLQNSTDQLMERLRVLEGTLSLVIEASGEVGKKIDRDPATRIRNAWNSLTTEIDDFISRIPDPDFQTHIRSRDRRNPAEYFRIFVDSAIFSVNDMNRLNDFIGLHNRTRGKRARDGLTAVNASEAEETQEHLALLLEEFDSGGLKLPEPSVVVQT